MRVRLTSPLYVVSAFAIVATLISFAPFFYEVFDLRTLAPDTGFGIVLPFVSLFLIWRERDKLRGIPITGSWYGLVLVAAGLALRAGLALLIAQLLLSLDHSSILT